MSCTHDRQLPDFKGWRHCHVRNWSASPRVAFRTASRADDLQTLSCVYREPVLVGGYYLKTRRNVSNSPFFVKDARIGETSVQEAIGDLLIEAFGAEVRALSSLC